MENQLNCCEGKKGIESEQKFKLILHELPDRKIYIRVSASRLCDVISILDKQFHIEIDK